MALEGLVREIMGQRALRDEIDVTKNYIAAQGQLIGLA